MVPLPAPRPESATPVLMSWSGGKDSALALHALLRDPRWEVAGLLCAIAGEFNRVSHHGVRADLIEAQADAIGLPLTRVVVPAGAANSVWEERMHATLLDCRARGVRHMAHGDLHLQCIRDYRERHLAEVGMRGVFPLWGRAPDSVLDAFLRLGFRAHLCCVEASLGARYAGHAIDDTFRRALPPGVDPCGERGEYHSFVWDGPIFNHPVAVRRGATVERDGRWYTDLLACDDSSADSPHSEPNKRPS